MVNTENYWKQPKTTENCRKLTKNYRKLPKTTENFPRNYLNNDFENEHCINCDVTEYVLMVIFQNVMGNCWTAVKWTMYYYNSTQLNEHLWTQVLKHLNVHIYLVTIAYQYYDQLISHTDLSPIPVRSAAKSYITSWCIQNLSKRVLNRQTV